MPSWRAGSTRWRAEVLTKIVAELEQFPLRLASHPDERTEVGFELRVPPEQPLVRQPRVSQSRVEQLARELPPWRGSSASAEG
jgi:hypothetical protein